MDASYVTLFAYPGLVDRESSVAIRAFASPASAEEASRGGILRLLLLQMGTSLPKIERDLPSSLALNALEARIGKGSATLRRQIAARALDEAFGLRAPSSLPRSRAVFNERLDAGRRRLPAILGSLGKLAQEIGAELDRTEAALRATAGAPGAPRSAIDDMRTQLAHLLPPGLLLREPLDRLAHLPRYLRAVRVRLERLPNGPQKDQSKAQQVLPAFSDYLRQRDALASRGVPAEDLEAFRWLLEELRVSLFAPELKTPIPVSPQRVAEQWADLTR